MTTEELGEIKREFRPGKETLVAGMIIGLLLLGAGCAAVYISAKGLIESGGTLPLWTGKGQKGWSWGAIGLFAGIGIGLIIGGVFLILWMRSLRSLRVRISQNGFSVTQQKNAQVFAWEEIASVQEKHHYERAPFVKGVAKYAVPKTLSKHFQVRFKQGEPFEFDRDTIKDCSKLARMIKEETDRRNIPWEIVEEHE